MADNNYIIMFIFWGDSNYYYPIIIASNFIENNHFAVVFSLIWELLSIPFLITIAIRIVRKSREKQ